MALLSSTAHSAQSFCSWYAPPPVKSWGAVVIEKAWNAFEAVQVRLLVCSVDPWSAVGHIASI